jgi:ABC-type polysaccharide/polyol phosphate transport system ATPase subunit
VLKDLKKTENEDSQEQERKKDKKKKKRDVGDLMNDYQDDLSFDKVGKSQKDSVKTEKKKVKDAEKNGIACEGLRIIGLKKTYFQKSFGRKSDKDVHAVRGIYLEVPDRELLCLLGHNGAGKSTLFSMLTGVTEPTEGSAKICGFDIT